MWKRPFSSITITEQITEKNFDTNYHYHWSVAASSSLSSVVLHILLLTRNVPHWQCGETQHLKFTNVTGIDPATSDLRLNFVRNENTFITFNPHLELTGHHHLSPSLGYNSQLPICAPLFSFTCWGQAITNFFHKNFSFTWLLIQRSCDIL